MSPEDGEYHELPIDSVDPARAVKLELDVGDIAIFGGFHAAPLIAKSVGRIPPATVPELQRLLRRRTQRKRHYQEFLVWLRGKYAQYGRHNVYFDETKDRT